MRLVLVILVLLRSAFSLLADSPDVVNLCDQQTPIRSQGGRDGCTYFPPIAALEAEYRRQGMNVTLSTEHLIWIRNVTAIKSSTKDSSINENNLAFLTGGGLSTNFGLLTRYGVCHEEHFPYLNDHENYKSKHYLGFDVTDYKWFEPHRQRSLNCFNLDPKHYPEKAHRARYGIEEYEFLKGKDCKDVKKIEDILASGHEVAVNMFVKFKHDPKDQTRGAIPPIVWYRPKDAVAEDSNSHAMLLVGYDRPRQFFIVKNSWGKVKKGYDAFALPEGWKDIVKYEGFTLIHYNYLNGNREAAYIKKIVNPKSDKYANQPLLGMWNYKISTKNSNEVLSRGVLAWRKLPEPENKSWRIGDLYTSDSKELRVNAEIKDGTSRKISIRFHPMDSNLKAKELQGVLINGTFHIPESGPCTMEGREFVLPEDAKQWLGVSEAELLFTAVQCNGENPLLELGKLRNKESK